MKTLVIGGTGFLGAHIVEALLAAWHNGTVVSRDREPAMREMPEAVEIIEGDISVLDQAALTTMLSPFEKLVYAAGVDERVGPDTEAREFFFRENVHTCRKVLLATRDTGISHVALLNSIFTRIDRLRNELRTLLFSPALGGTDLRPHFSFFLKKAPPWIA